MKKPPILWLNVSLFTITFLVAAVGTPLYLFYQGFSWGLFTAFAALAIYAGISITAGYHRLWSHRAWDGHWSVRLFFALGGALALQNSILHWASDHREHHKHVDHKDNDPYSISRGFWFAHIGWMLREYHEHRYNDYSNVKDLQKDKIVMWQHKYYLPLMLFMNVGVPLLIGLALGQVWGALLIAGFLRLVIGHHTTFFINSLAHVWGKQTFTDRNSARDNGWIALLTYGEGYHNFHHIFSGDYRNGIRWYHFDPSKWLIRAFSWVGLAKNLKKANPYQIEKARLEMKIKRVVAKKPWLAERLHEEYEVILAEMQAYYQTQKQWLTRRKQIQRQLRA
ncbi:acyl-CoA desaturase [Aliidiomarina iranensis]|uniref:Acyl-CoA desaturase n=1 Tax=Aliidiomarina iranensis TaxID=1434071 RepID=A0A432W372_9GAMM|nr:fatty acid desaturase [Aliidiomarina iranensis]RUO23682.1 acyl-CoA desaturase [Aliidiomarina iranensis]